MPRSSEERSFTNAIGRVCLWFGSLLIAVLLFSVLFGMIFSTTGSIFPIFRVALMFALPVGCLYLPVLIVFRNMEMRRKLIMLVGGVLIGPISIALWCLVLQVGGGSAHEVWYGDPLIGVGGLSGMLFALVISSLTTSVYFLALKALHLDQ